MTKNISISDNAYMRLANLRKKNESFSEIIIEITNGNVRLQDFHGILSKEAGDELERIIMERRKSHLKSRQERLKRVSQEMHD